MTSRDFFDSVRDAALDAERTRRQLEAMESREGVKAQRYGASVQGGNHDVMAATDARIDRERAWANRIERDYAIIDEACAIIYGTDGRGGIASLLGNPTADAMYWRYCAAASWEGVAKAVSYSRSWCYQAVSVALDLVDALGVQRVKDGTGSAEG